MEGRRDLVGLLSGKQDSESGLREPGKEGTTTSKHMQIVDWDGYLGIDRHEVARGALKGKPRDKLVDVRDMLAIAGEKK